MKLRVSIDYEAEEDGQSTSFLNALGEFLRTVTVVKVGGVEVEIMAADPD